MLHIFMIHKLLTTQVGPEMNIYCYNCNGVEMAGDTYTLNMRCAGLNMFYNIID